MATLLMLFGDPTAVATRHTLTGKAHAHMASWLRCAEAMLRRLILIEASAIAKPNTRALLKPRRSRTRKLMVFTPEEPEKWRTSFRMFAPAPRTPARKTPGAAAAARLEQLRKLGALPGEPIFIFRERCSSRAKPPPKERYILPPRARPATTRERIRAQDCFWVDERDLKPLVFRSAWPLAERYEALLRAFHDPAPYARRAARRLHATPHRIEEALRAPPEAAHLVQRFSQMGERAARRWRAHFSSG
ncbi:MAG: hypothetical protein NT015_10420 [Alphaproteobacteria bacterium]|nr:hypothetical protein [Alphaproteobacteria bacterium]